MAVRIEVSQSQRAALGKIARSDEVGAALEPLADAVLESARNDPNPEYVAGLRKHRFVTDRVVWQVGAAPVIGDRVEAKRGTLARALGAAGL